MKKINGIRRCRLCACEESFNSFSNIFEEDSELELEIKITKLLPVVVMPWDPMPHLVCRECVCKLNSFNDFYETSLRAERFLRTLHPSAPEGELENLDPVVRVMDTPILARNPLKSPGRKRPGIPAMARKTRKSIADSTEFLQSPEGKPEAAYPKRSLNCFIVNHITTRDSVFTCRDCYRTFTTQSSALTHSCDGLEDCGEEIDGSGDSGKSLPPLKIRLFSKRCGLFVCYLCQTAFEMKTELVEHIKRHFVDGNWETEVGKKCKQKGRKRGRQKGEEDGGEEKKPVRRKRRKCLGPPKKRGRSKSGESCPNGACEKCGKTRDGPNSKDTMERMIQYSETGTCSEEGEVKDEVVLNSKTFGEENRRNPVFAEEVLAMRKEEESGPEALEANYNSDDPVEVLQDEGGECISDEVTVLQVFNNRTPTNFSSCVFCDKIFATKEALIGHQNKHLQGYAGLKSELGETVPALPGTVEEAAAPCRVCAMTFTSRKTLLEHEQFHHVDGDPVGGERKIRIALGPQFPDREPEQEGQTGGGRGFITITVTSSEKKIPQIELI